MDRGLNTFKTVYLELIGNDATAKEIADFLSSRTGPDATQIRNYLVRTPMFMNKYTLVIRSLYHMYLSKEPSDDVIQGFLKDMCDPDFDLENAIKQCAVTPAQTTIATKPNTSDVGVSTSSYCGQHDAVANVANIAPEMNVSEVDAFEKLAHRPMSVYEYFKYVVNVEKNVKMDWVDVWKSQVEAFNRIRNLMHDFCEVDLTEHEFLKEHLFHLDDEDFEKQLVEDIVYSDVYEKTMKVRLLKLHKETFDSDMTQIDVDYLFEQVRADKRSLATAELRNVVMEFYKATNNIIAHASEIYNKVLDRYPDSDELVEVVAMYRKNNHRSTDDIAVELERSIIQSLEFVDVLRARVQKTAAANGKTLIPSKLYGIIQKILVNINTLTMDTLNAEIMNYLA